MTAMSRLRRAPARRDSARSAIRCAGQRSEQGIIAVLDSETGEEPAWSPLVRYLGFPSGRIKPTSVCWSLHRAKPSEWPQDATSSTSTPMKDTQPPLMIMAAVDGEVIGLRLDLFKVDSLPLDCPPGPISSRETSDRACANTMSQ